MKSFASCPNRDRIEHTRIGANPEIKVAEYFDDQKKSRLSGLGNVQIARTIRAGLVSLR